MQDATKKHAQRVNAAKDVLVAHVPMSNLRFLGSGLFWTCFLITFAVSTLFFGWELRFIPLPFPMLPRVPATTIDYAFTGGLIVLLSLAAGLFGWQQRYGSCPVGVKRTFGMAGTLGGIALLCPVCLALPGALLGLGTILAVIGPFLPLIRLLAIVFAAVAVYLLWPKKA